MMDTSQFCCPNEECADYGKRGKGNLVCNRRYGKQGTPLLKCKTCEKSFSENRGTPFFNLRTPKEDVVGALKGAAADQQEGRRAVDVVRRAAAGGLG
jgi:hypothetical protein